MSSNNYLGGSKLLSDNGSKIMAIDTAQTWRSLRQSLAERIVASPVQNHVKGTSMETAT